MKGVYHYFGRSIPNKHNEKEISEFLEKNPDYATKQYIVEHKYDGSNFQIIFTKEQGGDNESIVKTQFASRNCILGPGDSFNSYKTILSEEKHKKALENVKNYFIESNFESINLFGEIFGNVQKRIKYDLDEKNKILYFDVVFDGMYQNAKFFINWAKKMDLPIVESFMIGSFEECLNFDLNVCKTEAGDCIEGVVIKPYDDETTKPFYIKKKMPGFEEIVVKKTEKNPKTKSEKDVKLKAMFEQYPELENFSNYLNPNRAMSAFSKRPWTKKELPALANEIINDAFKDFKIDYETTKLTIDLIKKFYQSETFKISFLLFYGFEKRDEILK
ncbi:RNA Rnl2 family [Brachionus plicatilis]|uniref:RNA Rnl2 family n=1 Tax=Brachionus plicatilis TaxID=10195 RepID=A0A3M7PBG2_BRAPC|nr:RNA Rnl2 family [Brachionus plicatilis]